MDRQDAALLHRYRHEARKEPRTCLLESCDKPAIASHILQRNGLLSELAADGHVIELREDNIIDRLLLPVESRRPYYFERVGVNKAFTFLGFCDEHDTRVFSEIEVGTLVEPVTRRAPLLFSYRGLVNEVRKCENNRRWYRRIFANADLCTRLGAQFVSEFHERDVLMADQLAFLQRTERVLEFALGLGPEPRPAELSGPSTLDFGTCVVGRLPVCTSTIFARHMPPDSLQPLLHARITAGVDLGYDFPCYFLNVIPAPATKTTIIFGYQGSPTHRDVPSGYTSDLLSDLLLRHVETWACSPDWYASRLQPNEHRVLDEIHRLLWRKDLSAELNIFEL